MRPRRPVTGLRGTRHLVRRLFGYRRGRCRLYAGRLDCVCTTAECRRDGTTTCRADNFCYVQLIPPVSAAVSPPPPPDSPGAPAAAAAVAAAVTRGCIDDGTPLLCENQRPSTYRGAWPVLHCCRRDRCNHHAVVPTLPPWARHVEGCIRSRRLPSVVYFARSSSN